jgi:hypothetical protein
LIGVVLGENDGLAVGVDVMGWALGALVVGEEDVGEADGIGDEGGAVGRAVGASVTGFFVGDDVHISR